MTDTTTTAPHALDRLREKHLDILHLSARINGADNTVPLPLPDWAYDEVRASINYRNGRLAALTFVISKHPEVVPTLETALAIEIDMARREERLIEQLSWLHANRPAHEVRHWNDLDWFGLSCTLPGCQA